MEQQPLLPNGPELNAQNREHLALPAQRFVAKRLAPRAVTREQATIYPEAVVSPARTNREEGSLAVHEVIV